MTDVAREISDALIDRPLDALRLYEQHRSSPEGEMLCRRFDSEMKVLAAASRIDRRGVLEELPQLRADARRDTRERLMRVVIARLWELANEPATLRQIGGVFEALVLEGSIPQQFCCKLGTRLGLQARIPESIRIEIARPLERALVTVIEIGAPTTRDAAVEGLGALLKVIGGDAAAVFPIQEPLPIPFDGDPQDEKQQKDHEQRERIRDDYFVRFRRRRLIVLTVAGHDAAVREFDSKLVVEIGPIIGGPSTSEQNIVDMLYERQDLLRFLPGIARQRNDDSALASTVELLRKAMSVRLHKDEQRSEVLIAFARFQESVFRTVDTALRRRWEWRDFDHELALGVEAIPRVLTGEAAVCNARVRATVAILRTAIQVMRAATASEKPRTTEAVRNCFAELSRRTPWANPGIAEGCYRGLPQLVGNPARDAMTGPALESLCTDLTRPVTADDLVLTLRGLVASSCFRRLLVSLTDDLLERRLFETDDEAVLDEMQVDRHIRIVLRDPKPATIRDVCQHKGNVSGGAAVPGLRAAEIAPRGTGAPEDFELRRPSARFRTSLANPWPTGANGRAGGDGPDEVSETVIMSIAFESDALRRSGALFSRWNRLTAVERLLATRILAAQLHALSRDAPEVARHDLLRRVLLNTPGVSIPDDEAATLVWRLLSSLPSDAAEVADLEIQRYAEYRGRRGRGVDDLPGYVLAMIPPDESSRIDSAIAREIDLTRRRDRARTGADFAKALYQVTLRGPHESVFDHLIPRLKRDEQEDRQIALLFRRHVANVRAELGMDGRRMLKHVDALTREIKNSSSRTLRDLHELLLLYRSLYADEPDRWSVLVNGGEDGGVALLFRRLDTLAKAADDDDTTDGSRVPLLETFKSSAAQIRSDVARYLELPVGQFDARRTALDHARGEAKRVREALATHPGLQPPERIMLTSLMVRLEEFFTRTIRWFCDEPEHRKRARKEARDPEMFFNLFASPDRPFSPEFRVAAPYPKVPTAPRTHEEYLRITNSAGAFPAEFPEQRARFERFFVDWMTSELDVDMLSRQLRDRWSRTFRFAYWGMSTFAAISGLILFPCLIAATLHWLDLHEMEGAGFLVLQGVVWTVAFVTFVSWFRRLAVGLATLPKRVWRRLRKMKSPVDDLPAPKSPPYRTEAVLLRLTRLIAVPMALTIELEHAYAFPLHASTWVLVLLMFVSYVTTRFFVDRELVDPSEPPQVRQTRASERIRVRQVVAVALSHAFMVAVLLSAIFGSHADFIQPHLHDPVEVKEASGLVGIVEEIFRHVDRAPSKDDKHHKHPFFAGVLPREVHFNTSTVLKRVRLPISQAIGAHLEFTFYPTIILTWTALGLFVGVFLEGFVKGERLRGGEAPKGEPTR